MSVWIKDSSMRLQTTNTKPPTDPKSSETRATTLADDSFGKATSSRPQIIPATRKAETPRRLDA